MTYDMKLCEVRDETSRDTKIATTRNLLSMGLSVQQVAQGTGLSVDEVEALR